MTVEDMILARWCDDCDQDPVECLNLGRCLGETDEEDNDNA